MSDATQDQGLVGDGHLDEDNQVARDMVAEKFDDASTPGHAAEFSPLEADCAGAFTEDALREHDARESADDLLHLGPTFVSGDIAGRDLPDHVTVKTSRDVFGGTLAELVASVAERTKDS